MHILTRSLTNSKYSTYLIFISTKFLALFSFTCRSSCRLLFHLFSFLTLIDINISPGKKTTYMFILTNILFLFGYNVLKFGMAFFSHFVIHLLFLVININREIIFNHYKFKLGWAQFLYYYYYYFSFIFFFSLQTLSFITFCTLSLIVMFILLYKQ